MDQQTSSSQLPQSNTSPSSSSSHGFILVSNSDSLNHFGPHQKKHSHSRSPRKVQSPTFEAQTTKENHQPFPTSSDSPSLPHKSSLTKTSNQVKGNTRSYKQIMRPASPDRPQADPSHRPGAANGSGNRSRSRNRKVSSVVIESKEWEKVYKQQTNEEVEEEFETMLTDLEIAPALRAKLTAMDPTVKSSMLKGQATLNLSPLADAYGNFSEGSKPRVRSPSKSNANPNARGAIPFKGIRNSKSSSSLADEDLDSRRRDRHQIASKAEDDADDDQLFVAPKRKSLFGGGSHRSASGGNSIGNSSSNSHLPMGSPEKIQSDTSAHRTQHLSSSPPKSSSKSRIRTTSFGKDVLTPSAFRESPHTFATLLQSCSSPSLPLPSLKRLRVLLSTESPSWLGEFISHGGYNGLLARLDEIFEMEWREDVRDDDVLHEILRGLNALASTPKGKAAVSRDFPQPFTKMIDLLFSEKRPGDISTRKLMVELMMSMHDLPITVPLRSGSAHKDEHQDHGLEQDNDQDLYSSIFDSRVPSSSFSLARMSCDSKTSTAFLILLLLLHNPRTPIQDSLLSFVKQAHAQRPFKVYLTEVAGTCRDYFWIFCHSQNRFWRLEDVDIKEVEGPKVPGGMTGGVEFEAMGYLTTHMKLVNAMASQLQDACEGKRGGEALAAYEFHQMMFASGWERILATIRRSSQVYYAPLHLELARYFYLTSLCRFQVPSNLSVWFATPRLNKGTAPSLSDQMMAARLNNQRGTPHAATAIPGVDSPQILDLPKMEPLDLGLDQDRASASPKRQPQQSPQPLAEKPRRELPSVPQPQPAPSRTIPGIAATKTSETLSSPTKAPKDLTSEPSLSSTSTFAPSSRDVEQPFSSGRWMANGRGIGAPPCSPPKSTAARTKSPQRRPHLPQEAATSSITQDKVSGSVKITSTLMTDGVDPSSATKQTTSTLPQSSISRTEDSSNHAGKSSKSFGSPLPNPFDRFYPDPPSSQPACQPLSPQSSAQIPISIRQNEQTPSGVRETEMGPTLPKRGAQDSVVGTAIKRWEMRAQEVIPSQNTPKIRNQSGQSPDINARIPAGLGLGWAGNARS